jgi:hypothetical protein
VGTDSNVWVWFRKNGNDLPNSTFAATTSKNTESLNTSTWVLTLNANDTVQVVWAHDSSLQMTYFGPNSAPAGFQMPAAPSAIVTVVPIGA